MEDSPYEIVINPLKPVRCSFREYLFNQPVQLLKQPCKQVYTFYLIHRKEQQAYARFSLFIQADKGISPCQGPFGSVEMNPGLPVRYLDGFMEAIDAFAAQRGVGQMEIKSYPFCYDPEVSAILTASLHRQHYSILYTELNYHIAVTAADFADQIHLSEKRKLQRCIAKGLTFGKENAPDLELIYSLIVQNRQQKGYPVSLEFSAFRQLVEEFPEVYKVFCVKDKERIVAATVAVEINKQVVYYFLPAHDPAYNAYSPMVLLIQGLYQYCQNEGFSLLDLGISTDKGMPNYGLMRFKQNLGAAASLKLSFVKKLK